MDKHMKSREQIGKIVTQQDKLHRGRAVADAMREAEEMGNQYRHSPQWQQDLSRDQVNKRRQALKELVRTNRDPRQEVDSHFPGNIGRPVPPEQIAASRMRELGLTPLTTHLAVAQYRRWACMEWGRRVFAQPLDLPQGKLVARRPWAVRPHPELLHVLRLPPLPRQQALA